MDSVGHGCSFDRRVRRSRRALSHPVHTPPALIRIAASVRPERAKCIAAASASLSASEFAAAWARGRAMPLDVAATYARTVEPARPADTPREPTPARLTRREREVLALVARGNTNREIASALVLSHRTVKRHLDNIFANEFKAICNGQIIRYYSFKQ